MDDVFGRIPVPEFMIHNTSIAFYSTWTVLIVESFLPFGLWIRPLRKLALFLAFGLHIAIESTMHLFLFEWIMMAGLLAFIMPPPSDKPKAIASQSHQTPTINSQHLRQQQD